MKTPASERTRYSIARRLFYSHLLIALLLSLLVGVYFYLSTQRELLRAQRTILAQTGTALAERLAAAGVQDAQPPQLQQLQQLLAAAVSGDARLARIDLLRVEAGAADHDARLLASSDSQTRSGDPLPPGSLPAGGFTAVATDVRISALGQISSLRALVPVPGGSASGPRHAVLLALEHAAIEETLATLRRNAGLAFVLAVILALAVSQWLARAARRVLGAFVEFCGELAEGRFDRRVELTGDDEFVRLGHAFNDMAARLKLTLTERESALGQARQARDQLEANVRERTRELERLNVLLRNEAEQRSRMEAALAEAAATDPMTKLLNRRGMLELIEQMVARLRRQARFFCVLVIDVDHFKRINDHYGHSMGDQVLIALAALLKSELKSDEAAARWGGEEFLMLWPDIGLTAAEHRANRIRELVGSRPPVAGGPVVTISMGIAEFTGLESVDTCLIKADRALYRAKEEGRNRVVVGV